MPRLRNALPKLRFHKSRNLAVVTIDGRDVYCGKWGSKESKQEYQRLLAEWLSNGRSQPTTAFETTVVELVRDYLVWAVGYYRKHGRETAQTGVVRAAISPLVKLYAEHPAASFGPLALSAVRDLWVAGGAARSYANKLTDCVKRMFRWAVAQQRIPASTYQALACLPGLKKGRTKAKEPEPIAPVPLPVLEATLPALSRTIAAMVQLQYLTAMRPGEVCLVRPCDIDRTNATWIYRPSTHKLEHRDIGRTIFFGPKAQAILRPYLEREPEQFCFVPRETDSARREKQTEVRRAPKNCGNRPGTNRKRQPRRRPGEQYSANTYRQAIHRAVTKLNAERAEQKADPLPNWHPNQLRHLRATEIRSAYGLEAAQVVLGHTKAETTQVYAERDMQKAAEVAKNVG